MSVLKKENWNNSYKNKDNFVFYPNEEIIRFISKYVSDKKSPMCGNTVSHDRRFLIKYMPTLEAYFNYRHIDVSTVKELATRWMNEAQVYEKNGAHRAMGDIKDSVEELRFYKNLIFNEEELF